MLQMAAKNPAIQLRKNALSPGLDVNAVDLIGGSRRQNEIQNKVQAYNRWSTLSSEVRIWLPSGSEI